MLIFDDGRVEFEFMNAPRPSSDEGYFEFRRSSGEVLARSTSLDGASWPPHPDAERELVFLDVLLPDGRAGRAASLVFQVRLDSQYLRAGAVPPAAQDPLIVMTAVDRGPLDAALAALLGTLVVVGGAVGITAALLVIVGIRWGFRPLDRLRARIEGVGGETIDGRIDPSGAPRELLPVYREVNGMLRRIEATLARERTFADATAHELRTPLAELRASCEVALRWPEPEQAVASLRDVLAICREMERLVESLLLISRGRSESGQPAAARVPVAPIVHRCLDGARELIDGKQLRITLQLEDGDRLVASPDAMEIIARNLIDNAVHYTPRGGSMLIRTEVGEDGLFALVVENGPVALTEGDLVRLFEPFWRTDGARSDRRHVGLGLTVVDRIARATRLSVRAGLEGDRLRIQVSQAA
jgi:signal transduction histidine kinase